MMTDEGRYQVESRALRLAMERAIGVMMDARGRSLEDHTREAITASIQLMRDTASIDFSDEEQRNAYRVPGAIAPIKTE